MRYNSFLLFILLSLLFFISACGFPGGFSGFSSNKPLSDGSTSCNTANDCVLVDVDCCGCASDGEAIAVHKLQKDAHNKALSARCGNPAERMCLRRFRCSEYEVQCQNSQCVAIEKS